MRKLSELLPIARCYLVRVDDSREVTETFTCFAASLARRYGAMTLVEDRALREAIEDELVQQVGWCGISTIMALAQHKSDLWFNSRRCPKYIAFRDKWLDEFQTKLERSE